MFDPVKELHDNPALFACYVLFVYFRGKNAVRIEREMRALGHHTFHRRNLYPRGRQPGWIARYGWQQLSVPPAVASGSTRTIDPPGIPANSTNDSKEGRFTPAPSSLQERGGKPAFPTEIGSLARSTRLPDIPHSALRTPQSNDFHAWLKRVSPTMTWDWRHQQVIIEQLKKVTTGDCKRLMIFLPPRHGKSELVSVRYTAWRMQQDPSMNVILGSYNQRLADRMSRKIRTVVCDAESMDSGQRTMDNAGRSTRKADQTSRNTPGSETIHSPLSTIHSQETVHSQLSTVNSSPFPFSRPRPKNAVSEWETATGGSFRAVGAGSGVTGFGANLIVIDDPVKNRAQAESETYRNRVWDWYKDDLYTRLEPDGSIVLIQTRWHEDDLAGRLLRDDHDNWTIINLPALSEPSELRNAECGTRNEESTAETTQPRSVPPAVAGVSTQPIETPDGNASVNERGDAADNDDANLTSNPGSEINSTDLSQEGRFTPVPESAEISGGKPAFPTATVNLESEIVHSPLSIIHCPEIVHSPLSNVHCFDWREPGEALCPERFDIDALDKLKTQLGTYSFSALYQQRPTPAGGQIFKREWFKNIIDFAPPGLKWKRGYDLAVSTRTESDYTASFRCAFDKQGNLYIAGGYRRRIEFPEQRRYIIGRMLTEPNTEHGVELALHGQALIQDLRRDPALRGKSLSGVKVSTDKLTRALTWSPLAEEGKVILVRTAIENGQRTMDNAGRSTPPTSTRSATDLSREGGLAPAQASRGKSGGKPPFPTETDCVDTEISPHPGRNATVKERGNRSEIVHSPLSIVSWIEDLLDELTAFPNGSHDDQIDAISLAVQMLAKRQFKSRGYLIT